MTKRWQDQQMREKTDEKMKTKRKKEKKYDTLNEQQKMSVSLPQKITSSGNNQETDKVDKK